MTYCGLCGGLLPQGDYKFCGHCGQPIISQETTQIYPVAPTVPVLPLPPTRKTLANQGREQAYESLRQQYEAEFATAVIVRTRDNHVGKLVSIVPENVWVGYSQSQAEQTDSIQRSRVDRLSVDGLTIPVAIFKFQLDKSDNFSTGNYMIWMNISTIWNIWLGTNRNTPLKRISITDKKVTFVDLR